MMRSRWSLLFALVAMFAVGCQKEDPIVRVQENAVDKSLFQGAWYMTRTVVDVDYESAGIGTFPGDAASDFGGSFAGVPRIRWVIDENFLYAYRDYELVAGLDGNNGGVGTDGTVLGQPVAAFRIHSHFDIRRDYNPLTGEEQNVIVENTQDRRWYEREFMRVDWSQNLLPGYYGITADLYDVLGYYRRESVPFFVQPGSDFPDEWRPRFDRMPCASEDDTSCKPYERDLAADYEQGELYHMSFVTQEMISPGDIPDPFTGEIVNFCTTIYSDAPDCGANAVFVRTSFLKVSDSHQYVAENWGPTRFDRHGYFRLENQTFDRSSGPDDPQYGATDFLNYNVNRHNIWKQWYTEDDQGNRTSVPYSEREVRPIVWYTTPELPAHLVKPSFDLVGQWNEVFMRTVRQVRGQESPTYPDVECQTDDPGAYCYCITDPTNSRNVLNPTCPGHYDPLVKPEDAVAAGATNPYDCYVAIPEGAEPDMSRDDLSDGDFEGWFSAEMRGTECVNILRINTCNRASIAAAGSIDNLDCEQRGDARFKFLSYVDQPGTDFLGIATLRGDPVTGETLFGDANIGGPALDGYRTSAMQQYDLIKGNISEAEIATGEDIRQYLETINRVQLPSTPREDFFPGNWTPTPTSTSGSALAGQFDQRFAERISRLQGQAGRANTFSSRLQNLAGSSIERALVSNPEFLAIAGLESIPAGFDTSNMPESLMNVVSPFRVHPLQMLQSQEDLERRMGKWNLHMPNEYVDTSISYWVEQHANLEWTRARVEFEMNRLLYRQTQVHEMGHCLGLRHDFGGSADTKNYHNEYYEIADRFPLPNPNTFDTDDENGLTATEMAAYRTAYARARKNRESSGIDIWMNSSIMDYTAQWYERTAPAGRYDHAAISFGYGDVVEIGDNSEGLAIQDTNPTNLPRVLARYYAGGEICQDDSDCPYSADGAKSAELLQTNRDAGFMQRCVTSNAAAVKVCSNFDDDVDAAVGSDESPRYVPIDYRFCTDERAAGLTTTPGTVGWCNRFDEGDSYREIVSNLAESYERMYIFSNFRRYRTSWGFGSYLGDQLLGRRLSILMNIYQNLAFAYTSDPEFRTNTGAFGFNDQFLATADILNFFARMLATPDVGGYSWNAAWNRYEKGSENPNPARSQLGLPVGLGRYFQTTYQTGLSGINRVERIGTFYDKYYAILLMTARGWQANYTPDVPFFVNFYDLFPSEVRQIFGGLFRDQPELYAPRVQCGTTSGFTCTNPSLVYMDFYEGDCRDPESDTCRGPADDRYSSLRVVNGGNNIYLQQLATTAALAEFPVFFDTSFQNELFVCTEGQADCRLPSAGAVEGTDYARYTSERFGRTYLSWQLGTEDHPSIGYALVDEAKKIDFTLRTLRKYIDLDLDADALTDEERDGLEALDYTLPTSASTANVEVQRLYRRLSDIESYFSWLQQVQREMGISTYLGFSE